MSGNAEDSRPGGRKTRSVWTELKSLIDTLLGLQTQISTRLFAARQEPQEISDGGPGDMPTLWDKLESSAKGVGRAAAEEAGLPSKPEHADDENHAAASEGLPLRPNELSEHLKIHDAGRGSHHGLTAKLRADTMDHINRALVLAKQGNRDGAYVHAELAENTMRLAWEHIPEPEYSALREEVDQRLENATGRCSKPS